MKQKLTELGSKTIQQAENFNISFSIMEKATRQKINTEKEDLNNTIKQLDLADTPLKRSRIHILFKCTRNIPQDRPFIRP